MQTSPLRTILFFLLLAFSVSACSQNEKEIEIGVLQWTEEVKPFLQTYAGVLAGLKDRGFQDGVNITIHYRNVNQDKKAALEAAQNFVSAGVTLMVTLGTGSSIAALQATERNRLPIVFSIVGAPQATGIISSYEDSGKNITGVSMKIPVADQFTRVRSILPDMKKLGVLYCSEMVQAVATGLEAVEAAPQFGWSATSRTLRLTELDKLGQTVENLARTVDAIYIPTDPILGSPQHLSTILDRADALGVPVIGVAKEFVENGVLAALHCDYFETGRQTADSIAKVINGIDVQEIPSQRPIVTELSINLKKAQQLSIPISRNVILRADNIID